jgi:exopolyphosphatase/guanosine-5'-triphosphate,3'-diphosphate pyrophosphatase
VLAGCIDIGSNTTRVLVADVREGALTEVLAQRRFTRLGKDLRATGCVSPAKIDEVAEVVAEQRELARAAGAQRIEVVATAALRGATNREDLVKAVWTRAGLDVTVLTGDEEARLAFLGATRTMPEMPAGMIGVVDVGGGSTEIAVGTPGGGVAWSTSIRIGSGFLADAYFHDDPPSAAELNAARAHAAGTLEGLAIPKPEHGVAVGGSAASLRQVLGPVLDPSSLARALETLGAGPSHDVAARFSLDPERVRLLPAGLIVLAEASAALDVPLQIGRGGIREGVCIELCERGDPVRRTLD